MFAETRLFTPAAAGGAEGMATRMGVPFLGRIPMDPALGQACELGRSVFGDGGSAEFDDQQAPQQNGDCTMDTADAHRPVASRGTLSSLRAIIDQLLQRMHPPAQAVAEPESGRVQQAALPLPAGNGAAGSAQQQQTLTKAAPQTVVHSNGDVPLDPDLHYRIHLGM